MEINSARRLSEEDLRTFLDLQERNRRLKGLLKEVCADRDRLQTELDVARTETGVLKRMVAGLSLDFADAKETVGSMGRDIIIYLEELEGVPSRIKDAYWGGFFAGVAHLSALRMRERRSADITPPGLGMARFANRLGGAILRVVDRTGESAAQTPLMYALD